MLALSLAAFTAAAPHQVHADAAYPTRPVRIVVPFAVGGVADTTVRTIAEKLGDKLGQRFYVDNLPGAGGIAAARGAVIISATRRPHADDLGQRHRRQRFAVPETAIRSGEGFRADFHFGFL